MSPSKKLINSDYIFHEMTRSICPECYQVIDAKVLIRDNRVYMTKWCREHGNFEVLISTDAEYYLNAGRYNRPGQRVKKPHTEKKLGCPLDCGICPDHEQHTCVGLIDITDKCNMHCPTCFADANGKTFLAYEQVEKMMRAYVEQEGNESVLQISGGEPTEHPRVVDILRLATEFGFRSVMLNTNGIRLAEDQEFLEALSELRTDIEIYLQFDGFRSQTSAHLRGEDYVNLKLKAIQNCIRYEIPMHLACTVKKGVNDCELGELVKFAIDTHFIRGINFQPAFWSGRFDRQVNPLERATLTDVIHAIEQQTEGMFRKSDFVPMPCSHPTCISMTYAWVKRGKVKPIPRFVDMDRYLNYFTNSAFMNPEVWYKEALENLFSMSTVVSSAKTMYDFACVCGNPFNKSILSKKERDKLQDQKLFRILILQFEDKYTFDVKRVKKCCIGHILPDGRIIPFCSYNTLYRSEVNVSTWASENLAVEE